MKKNEPEKLNDPNVVVSARIPKSKARKLKKYLFNKEQSLVHWVGEKIEELPDEEESRRYHRKAG